MKNLTAILLFFKQNLFQPIYSFEQKFSGVPQATWRLRIAEITLFTYQRWPSTKLPSWNSSTNIFYQTIYPLEQKLDGRLPATWRLRNSLNHCYLLRNKYSLYDTCNYSSEPYILLSRNLLEGFRQHGYSEIANIIPFAYQRLPSTKLPSWNSSTNIFKPIFSLEQKIDRSLQGKMETKNCLNHSIQISKTAIH